MGGSRGTPESSHRFAEEFIDMTQGSGEAPADYKLHCIHACLHSSRHQS